MFRRKETPAKGDWIGISFTADAERLETTQDEQYESGSIIQHATIEYAGYGSGSRPGKYYFFLLKESNSIISLISIEFQYEGVLCQFRDGDKLCGKSEYYYYL
jgi:hypothetical protein